MLLTELASIDIKDFTIEDQSRLLYIMTHKNLINPNFIQNHFLRVISLTSKEQAMRYIANLLESVSYVGFTDKINM